MKHSKKALGAIVAAATIFTFAGGHALSAAEPTVKVLADNEKVRVMEVTYRPDDATKVTLRRNFRVVRALKSGTLQRVYADGSVETWAMTAGEVKVYDADKKPFATKNAGRPRVPEINLYTRRSEILPISANAIAKKSIVIAKGCP